MSVIEINEIIVEWDEQKNRNNKKKHGISFEAAAYVFQDDNRIELYDEAHSVEENRYMIIGKARRLMFVVYTMRDERYRIITARKANSKEMRLYYGNHKSYN